MKTRVIASPLLVLGSLAEAQDPAGCADASPVDGRPFDIALDAYGNLHVAGSAGLYTSCDNGDEWTTAPGSGWPSISIHVNHTNPDLIAALIPATTSLYRARGEAVSGPSSRNPIADLE